MPKIEFQGDSYSLDDHENLLDGLLRLNAKAPYSCRAGVCHSCMLRVIDGCMPTNTQSSLTSAQIRKGYILACQTSVTDHLRLALPARDEAPGVLTELIPLSPTEMAIKVVTRLPFEVSPGEHITLVTREGLEASYPVTAFNEELQILEFHITRSAGGSPFSAWIYSSAQTGDRLVLMKQG